MNQPFQFACPACGTIQTMADFKCSGCGQSYQPKWGAGIDGSDYLSLADQEKVWADSNELRRARKEPVG